MDEWMILLIPLEGSLREIEERKKDRFGTVLIVISNQEIRMHSKELHPTKELCRFECWETQKSFLLFIK